MQLQVVFLTCRFRGGDGDFKDKVEFMMSGAVFDVAVLDQADEPSDFRLLEETLSKVDHSEPADNVRDLSSALKRALVNATRRPLAYRPPLTGQRASQRRNIGRQHPATTADDACTLS